MITITALLRAKAGHEDTVQAALLEIAGHVARDEPGTIGYHISRVGWRFELPDPGRYFASKVMVQFVSHSPVAGSW